jgi:hypothetical protein
VDSLVVVDVRVALNAQCDLVLWHRHFGHMHSLHAQHDHGVPTTSALPGYVKTVSCDSGLPHKACAAPHNFFARVLKIDSDSVFEAAVTRRMCGRMGVGVRYSAPYPQHTFGKMGR